MSRMDTGETAGPAPQLEPVSRKKLKRIRDQLEFYLSSANLSRDRFLQKSMCPPMSLQAPAETSCGCVELSVICEFPLMKELTGGSLELIRRGAELSSHLELSADKRTLRRRLPIVPLSEEETTQKTIYVEYIPPNLSTHTSLKRFFSKYGSVTHVSLPQYKIKKRLREGKIDISSKLFAFIEFATHQSALTAITAFEGKCQFNQLTSGTSDSIKSETEIMCPIKFGKDLTNTSSSSVTNNRKRRCEENHIEYETSGLCQGAKRKKDSLAPVLPLQAINTHTEELGEIACSQMGRVKKKKARNRRKPRKRQRERKMLVDINSNYTSATLRQMCVISKSDWLKKKTELKTVQRELMGHLKLVNKQVVIGTPVKRSIEQVACEEKDKEEERRGIDKILDQSMLIAEKVFKQK